MSTKTTETKNKRYDIVGGPNRDTLFDACKYANSKTAKINVDFTVVIRYVTFRNNLGYAYIPMAITNIQIIGIEHENGSGESFILKGYCRADLESTSKNTANYEPYRFEAYYNSGSRKGWISFTHQ